MKAGIAVALLGGVITIAAVFAAALLAFGVSAHSSAFWIALLVLVVLFEVAGVLRIAARSKRRRP